MRNRIKVLESLICFSILCGCSFFNNNESTQISSSNNQTTSLIESSTSSKNFSGSTNIGVNEVINISLNYVENIKYEYFLGEELDLSNVSINVLYEDGKVETINVTKDMIKLMDSSINQETTMNSQGYKMVVINYKNLETSYLIHVIDNNAPIDKTDPLVVFNFEAGAKFKIGSTEVPTVSVLPNDLDYEITYSSEESGYNSKEYPTIPGTYSLVVSFEGNDLYNSINTWRWFVLVGEKETATITFNYSGGDTFVIGASERPTVTVSEGADYEITYSSEESGYNSEEYPSTPGTYALVVTVNENELFAADKKWLWFRLVSNEKSVPEIVFNYNAGKTFYLSSLERPTVTVSEGADYVITYSSDTTGYNSTQFPTEAGVYSLVVTVNENDLFNADKKWRWFRLEA